MENASKALIIAGAILIAILLISIGIIVMNSINDPINQSEDEAKQQAIEMFNAKFTNYSGEQSAQGVRNLINTLYSAQASSVEDYEFEVLYVDRSAGGYRTHVDLGRLQKMLIDSEIYTVEMLDVKKKDGYLDRFYIRGEFN